jgi:hypothetical protein
MAAGPARAIACRGPRSRYDTACLVQVALCKEQAVNPCYLYRSRVQAQKAQKAQKACIRDRFCITLSRSSR